jgi:outer membrane cobalamin receptor
MLFLCITGFLILSFSGICYSTTGDNLGANVIILSKEDIDSYDASTIVELLNMLPGINTSDVGSLSMGGFNASDIIVTLDGRPINDQTITARYIKWSEVDYPSITKIEIHKISSRCSGGEINLFTEKRGDRVEGRFMAWRGARDHKGVNASLSKGIGDYFFSVAHNYKTEGEHHHNNNDAEYTSTLARFAWERNFSLNGSFSYSRDDKGSAIWSYDTPEKTRPAKSDDYYPDPSRPRYRKKRESYGGVINFDQDNLYAELFTNDHWKENKATGVHRDEEGNIIYEVDEGGNVNTIPYRRRNEVNVREYGGKIGIKKENYDYGLRSVLYTADFSKTSESTGETTEGDADEYLLDLFGGWRRRGFALSANIFYHKEYGFDFFPKIAYYKQFKPFFFDISFTSTKKYPSFFQKYFSTSYSRANPDLDPQTNLCVTLKIGGKHHPGANQFSWQVAPFFNKAYDRFYTHTYFQLDAQGNPIVDPDTGKKKVDYTRYENLDEAYWTGGDLIFKYIYGGWTGFDARFTINYTRDEVHDSSFPYFAPYKFKGRFFLKPVESLYFQLWYTYYSDRYADQAETYKMLWYHYWDLKATYHAKKNVGIYLEVKNLTDFDYYIYRGYPGNCRRWWVGMEIKF